MNIKEIVLAEEAEDGVFAAETLRNEMEWTRNSKSKLYSLAVDGPPPTSLPVHLVTTEKDVFLRLGLLSGEARQCLVELVWRKLDGKLGVTSIYEDDGKVGGLLATLSEDGDGRRILHLSSAH